ncbi:acetyl-CoA carboxylase biotin carboxyl carrier protein [Leptolyngbya sp. FACHB-261]|uniref:acetyl-CoA carboxylase biotin carboxyl carrier protein n=1 Tax=Leptolyngbya sp. FACHB-261 TaxID=2692806 RepID=UPI001687843A|nr:acetyl-CoA carboxylase biotin carboxyl carrier protein [Leptolyngbya sp. FACHB-261]MBD2102066.1 acetyl-CoA carboxylase biotin carboxyl carrier protein [Leptolyngbya sp. FACHB-261]
MELSLEELCQLITVLNQTDITELTLESEDLRLSIHKGTGQTLAAVAAAPTGSAASPPPQPMVAPTAATEPPLPPRNLVDITSPMVGTFYRAPGPDDPAFVGPGDTIRRGQTVCIIEAMKLMNELEAEVAGQVVEILVENAQPVEYGQVLMRVDPS